MLKWLSQHSQLLSSEAVGQVLMSVFQGLHTHGQHDANQSSLMALGLSAYELFIPVFPNLRQVSMEHGYFKVFSHAISSILFAGTLKNLTSKFD